MQVVTQFNNPDEVQITITLTGTIRDFRELSRSMAEKGVPYYQSRALVEQIAEAAMKMRGKIVLSAEEDADG